MTIDLRRSAGLVAAAAVSLALVLTPSAAQAAPSPQADAAGQWLVDQVPADSHLFESVYGEGEFDRFVDYGLNLDLQHALGALGEQSTADQIYDAVIADTAAYTDAWGTRYSGAMGKLATYVALHGDDATDIDGRDLIAQLAELMVPTGSEAGRLKDSPDGEYQSANTVGQSWGVRAFAAAESDSTGPAADFLADQQCEDGGFRLFQTGETCSSSVDATAFAVIALDEAGEHADAVSDARDYLIDQQAEDGSLSESDIANSNSTGLAALVLSAQGSAVAATAGADWIVSLQATESTSGLGDEAGAIAFSVASFADGTSDGIDDIERDQWVRTTVQAALALNLASEPAPGPGPVASMTLGVSSSSPKQGDTITVTATGKDADDASTGDVSDELTLTSSVDTDTIDGNTVRFNHASPHTITATHTPTGTTASITVEVSPAAVDSPATGTGTDTGAGTVDDSGVTAADVNGTLPDTGSAVQPWQLLAAAGLIVAGAGLVIEGRRRTTGTHAHAQR